MNEAGPGEVLDVTGWTEDEQAGGALLITEAGLYGPDGRADHIVFAAQMARGGRELGAEVARRPPAATGPYIGPGPGGDRVPVRAACPARG